MRVEIAQSDNSNAMAGVGVLHVVASAGRYGAEAVIAALAREQHALGLRVHVTIISDNLAATAAYAAELRDSSHAHVTVIEGRGTRDLFLTNRIGQIANEANASIIHSHGYKSDILCSRVAANGVRRVSTLHGWTSVKRWSKMALYQNMQVRSLVRFDAVIAVHDSVWRQHKGLSLLSGKSTIPNGIAASMAQDPPERQVDLGWLPTRKNVVVVAGRLSPEKGQAVAIHAIRALRERGTDALLVLAGEGPEKEHLSSQAEKLGIANAVVFPGYIQPITALLAVADVALIPSYREGLPIVLLEAMRSGTPVVVSAVGGMPSVLDFGRVGRLVTPGSAEEMAAALEGLLCNPDARRALGESARDHFVRRYSAEVMGKAYVSLYQRLRSERQSTARRPSTAGVAAR